MIPAYVSGGSNLDAVRNVVRAARALKSAYPGARFSRCYRSASTDSDGTDYLNFVAELPASGLPRELKSTLRRIEALCGRRRRSAHPAAVAMDLDLLLFGDVVLYGENLQLPRPEMRTRAFVLRPLAELAPQVRHPVAGVTAGTLWRAFDQNVQPLVAVDLDLNRS